MKIKVAVLFCLGLGVLALLWHQPDRGGRPVEVSSTANAPASLDTGTNVFSANQPTSPASPPGSVLARRADILWGPAPAEPAFAQFQEWANRYVLASDSEKKRLEAEGVALAQTRRRAMADLIQTNPKHALELAVPYSVRESLPAPVTTLLEEAVNTRANY